MNLLRLMSVLSVVSNMSYLASGKPRTSKEEGKCTLPVLADINYNMLPDAWYHILNTNDPVEHHVPCFALKYFRDTPDGAFAEFQDISYARDGEISFNGVIPVHWYHNGNSITRYDTSFEYLWVNEARLNGGGEQAVTEIHNFYKRPMSCLTDYEHYFMCLQCGVDGKRFIWVHSRNPHPTGVDILRIHNKLIEEGGDWSAVPLYLSDCRKFDMPDKIAY